MPKHDGSKKASERTIPAGQRFSANQTNQICGATLIAPLNHFRMGDKSNPKRIRSAFSVSDAKYGTQSCRSQAGFETGKEGVMIKKLHPNCPPKGAPLGFARSVRHWRSGLRIYPKTAKAFPIRGRKGGNDKRQLTLGV
jgi:hypothetical protein